MPAKPRPAGTAPADATPAADKTASRAHKGPSAGLAILGGSFNPPHVGHLRLAIEVRELLGPRVRGVDLVPCAVPPH